MLSERGVAGTVALYFRCILCENYSPNSFSIFLMRSVLVNLVSLSFFSSVCPLTPMFFEIFTIKILLFR